MKNKLADEVTMAAPTLKTSEMRWLMTVPAIWPKPDSKQMMREAAYMVCVLTMMDVNKGFDDTYYNINL